MNRTVRRVATALGAALAIVAGTAAAAAACHNTIAGTVVCDQATGLYTVTWRVANSETRDAETLSNASRVAAQLDGHTVSGSGSVTAVEQVAPGSGALTLRVTGYWASRRTTTTSSGSVFVPTGACAKPTPPPPSPPTPPAPPKCPGVCHLPVHAGSLGNLSCNGVYTSGTYRNVYIRPGAFCVLAGSVWVNGHVRGHGATSVTLAAKAVRGNVRIRNTEHVVLGSEGNCRVDPMYGGSVTVTGGGDVIVCKSTICHTLRIAHSDGRILVSASTMRRLDIVRNRHFDRPVHGHPGASVIRLHHVKAKRLHVRHNAPRHVRIT